MSDRSSFLRLVARRAGQLITVCALVFLAWALYQQWGAISHWRPTKAQIALFAVLAFSYSGALMLLAFNWVIIVQTLIVQSPPRAALLLSYTKTQIAKYVPGNVVHLVSRHMYLRNFGLNHRSLATGSLLELLSLPLAAVIAICLVMSLVDGSCLGPWEMDALAPPFFIAAVGVSTLAIWHAQRSWHLPAVIVVCRGVVFMMCQGIIFAVVLYIVSGSFVALAIPAAIFAWLVGFLTPGAPGGIAVREALLVSLLSHVAADDTVLIAALILRMTTTVGDLILYLFGNLVLMKYVPEITYDRRQ
jgi:hypothetical protein